MKEIELTRGCFTIVDDEDYERFSHLKWYCSSWGYATRQVRKNKRNKRYFLHREIMNPPEGMIVDHINQDRLDNRKINLRICTHTQNLWNVKRTMGIVSFDGVHLHKYNTKKHGIRIKYATRIRVDGKQKWLGSYATPEEASKVYQEACIKYRGEFAPSML